MTRAVAAALILAATAACIGSRTKPSDSERLYLALQIEEGPRVLARPKLLAETSREVTMRLVDPGQPELTRVALMLRPERQGAGYDVAVDLRLSDRARPLSGRLALLHGEERRLVLEPRDEPPVLVTLLLMRVDSPEFRTWMELTRRERAERAS